MFGFRAHTHMSFKKIFSIVFLFSMFLILKQENHHRPMATCPCPCLHFDRFFRLRRQRAQTSGGAGCCPMTIGDKFTVSNSQRQMASHNKVRRLSATMKVEVGAMEVCPKGDRGESAGLMRFLLWLYRISSNKRPSLIDGPSNSKLL
jgi:hypothetical protein